MDPFSSPYIISYSSPNNPFPHSLLRTRQTTQAQARPVCEFTHFVALRKAVEDCARMQSLRWGPPCPASKEWGFEVRFAGCRVWGLASLGLLVSQGLLGWLMAWMFKARNCTK